MKIRVKYHGDMPELKKIKVGDWVDLYTAEDASLEKGQYKLIPLGVSIELPEGYEALVAPRSSTFGKWGILLANSLGVIDNSYCGDNDIWQFPAFAARTTTIPKHTRIAQFRIVKSQPEFEIEAVETLGNVSRGGIGSTGER